MLQELRQEIEQATVQYSTIGVEGVHAIYVIKFSVCWDAYEDIGIVQLILTGKSTATNLPADRAKFYHPACSLLTKKFVTKKNLPTKDSVLAKSILLQRFRCYHTLTHFIGPLCRSVSYPSCDLQAMILSCASFNLSLISTA